MLVSTCNQRKKTVKREFGARVETENYYAGTQPILDSKTYPEFCRSGNLANSRRQDPMTYLLVVPHQ